MYTYESELIQTGLEHIAGIDEAGRGPLCGPVVAACVILPDQSIEGIKDSKKLSEKKRDFLFTELIKKAHVGVGVVGPQKIDELNILEATKYAMKLSVLDLAITPEFLLIDGKNMKLDLDRPQLSIIGGDQKSASIAAASIIAKVTRDRIMLQLDRFYPHYQLKQHKGYPTKQHMALIQEHGVKHFYRKTFGPVKRLLEVGAGLPRPYNIKSSL